MASTSRIVTLGLATLAGVAALVWQPAHAQTTCRTTAWSGVTGAPVASDPGNVANFKRYSGLCGLSPAATGPSYVEESVKHVGEGGAESPFRARFFVYTGISAGSPVVFRALDGSNNPVVSATYNRSTQNFTFNVAGVASAVNTANNSAPANKWIEVRVKYQAGTPFTATTRHLGVATNTTPTANVGAAVVESVRLGLVSGTATGNLYFDEYEASRAVADGPDVFSLLCRGDADGNGAYELDDIFGVTDEFLRNQGDSSRNFAAGQPDIDQNGLIELTDVFGVVDAFLAAQGGAPGTSCADAANQ